MKRIKSACLEQVLLFSLKDEMPADQARRILSAELSQYKARMDARRIKYTIVSETERPDGSIEVRIKKQYLTHDCGEYLND